jgi:hypothetical protein
MSASPARGDQAQVSVLVKVAPSEAFRIFTEEIDSWWRGGLKYRIGKRRSVVHLEPKLGGLLTGMRNRGYSVKFTGEERA